MCGVSDIADSVAMRKDKFIKRYSLDSSVVCEICSLILSLVVLLRHLQKLFSRFYQRYYLPHGRKSV